MITVELRGTEEVLAWYRKIHLVLSDPNLMRPAGEDLRDYAESITPVVTGRLAAGHEITSRGNDVVIFNRVPYAQNVHDMGGHRAFYDRTVEERWPRVADDLIKNLVGRL